MTTLTTASDLRSWMTARAQQDAGDEWLDSASDLRRSALDVNGVARLVDSASFRTHGRRRAVDGVALAPTVGGGVRAEVAVVLTAEAATEPGRLEAVSRAIEQALRATWDRRLDPRDLDLSVHVVDVESV